MTNIARFTPGRELARLLAGEIEPRLRMLLPDVPLSLAFIGPGSDVLGFDSPRSTDHDWGPRLTIVVPNAALPEVEQKVNLAINDLLPRTIAGFPTRFSHHPDGTTVGDVVGGVHRLQFTSMQEIINSSLQIEDLCILSDDVWLTTPMQTLLELTSGEVFTDDTGELSATRTLLKFYPGHLWRYQLSALWMRVGQVQPFIGRTGESGDDAGSAVITAGVARDLMRIALLQSRKYAPYAKWLGPACSHIRIGGSILPPLNRALNTVGWPEREQGINEAGVLLVRQLNETGLIGRTPAATEQFHSRPFRVLPAERIAHALQDSSAGTAGFHYFPPFIGGIDILTDSTDALGSPDFRLAMRPLYAG